MFSTFISVKNIFFKTLISMHNEIEILIQNALSPDTQTRNSAEQKLLILQQSNFSFFITNLTQILTTEETRSDIRFTAGIIARNSLNSSNYLQNQQIERQWLDIEPNTRNSIKQALFNNFTSTNQRSAIVSANVLACIARIEFLNNAWPDFFSVFFNEYKNSTNLNAQKNILTTISSSLFYLKEFAPQNQAYPIFVHKLLMFNENHSVEYDLLLHNLKNIYDSQDYLQKAISDNATFFTKLLLSTIQRVNNTENTSKVSTTELVSLSIQNIAKIVTYAIKNIQDLDSLFNFTVNFLEGEDTVILQAIEFFTAVSEHIKSNKALNEDFCQGNGAFDSDPVYKQFKAFIPILLPKLFYQLKKNDEYDDDEWSPHKASSACLQVISSFCNILGSEEVKKYIQDKVESANASEREEGIIAFGSSLYHTYIGGVVKSHELYSIKERSNGFDENKVREYVFVYEDDVTPDFINTMVKVLLIEIEKYHETIASNETITDNEALHTYPSTFLDSCLYCLAKICETNLMAITIQDFDKLMNVCLVILQMKKKESINAAWVIANACKSIANLSVEQMYENQLTLNYYGMLDVLVCTSDVVEFTNFNLRNAIFNAIQEDVRACPTVNFIALDSLWKYFHKKIYEFLSFINSANDDQFNIIEDLIANCVILMHTIYLKIDSTKNINNTLKKQNIKIYLDILNINRVSITFADVYSCLSVQCHEKSFFIDNIDKFIPYIKRDLFVYDHQIINSAVTLIGDIANSLSVGFLSCSKIFMPALIDCLQRNDIPKETKVLIINVFGDIAMSLGCSFEPYLEMCTNILDQIINLNREGNEEYVDELRKAVLNLLSCILISMEESTKLKGYIPGIIQIVKIISKDKSQNLNACFDILGDLGSFYGLKEQWMHEILAKYANDEMYGKNARKAMDKIFK